MGNIEESVAQGKNARVANVKYRVLVATCLAGHPSQNNRDSERSAP